MIKENLMKTKTPLTPQTTKTTKIMATPLFLAILLLASLLLTSCAFSSLGISDETVIQTTKLELEKKYNEEFVIDTPTLRSETYDFYKKYYVVEAYSKENPTIKFRASLDYGDSGVQLVDDYVAKKLCNNIANMVSYNLSNRENTGENFYVYVETATESFMILDPDITIEEYMEKYIHEKFEIYIYTTKDYIDNIQKNLDKALKHLDSISGYITIYKVDTKEIVADMMDYTQTHAVLYDEFTSVYNYLSLGSIAYTNGEITSTSEEIQKVFNK
jgi:hypothetical protein